MAAIDNACDLTHAPAATVSRPYVIAALVLFHFALASTVALTPFHAAGNDWRHRVLVGLVVGSAFAQISLTATWCALGPGIFFLRVPLSLLSAILAGLALAAFMLKTSGGHDFWFSVGLTLVGWFLLQPPLWFVSIRLKYRVSLPSDPSTQQGTGKQFTLAHMLLWTFGVALLLGIGRMALRNASISDTGDWQFMEISVFLTFVGVNLLLAIPVVLAVLGIQSPLRRIIVPAAWSMALGGVEWLSLACIAGFSNEPANFLLVMLLNGVHGLVIGGSLFALSKAGYRLRREIGSCPAPVLAIPSKD